MLLAELEVWHSRPFAPTRRIALGHLVLPADPAPGFGGILLAAVVATHADGVDPDLLPDLHRLIAQLQVGERVVQPRLRHRFQVDRHGLSRSVHRLTGTGEQLSFDIQTSGTPLQQVLGAVYAIERLAPSSRPTLAGALHTGLRWRGPLGQAFISRLLGGTVSSIGALADPVAWALTVLGFPPGTARPSKKDVLSRFRAQVRAVHPDHGGDSNRAGRALGELAEAREILLR
jgi:hypothetical protein